MSVEEQFPYNTATESVTERDWAAGTKEQGEHPEFVLDNVGGKLCGSYRNVTYAPAWLKIIDEPIVNACDHLVRCLATSEPVRNIDITFDAEGTVSVYNDGPGLPIKLHSVASEKLGRPTYVPSFVFGELFQGSNKKRSADSIIGGANGLGAKLSNCFSTEFSVETVSDGMYFHQTWRNRNSRVELPVVKPTRGMKPLQTNHTKLTFSPDYVGLFGYKSFGSEQYDNLVGVVRARVAFAAAYCHYTVGKKYIFRLRFNGEIVNIKSAKELCEVLLPGAKYFNAVIVPKPIVEHYNYPWEVCVVTNARVSQYSSNVNGIVVSQGRHVVQLIDQICDHVKTVVGKIFKDKNIDFRTSYVTDNIFVFVNSKIPNPTWTGQRKDQMSTVKTKFAGYELPQKLLKDVSAELQTIIMSAISSSRTKPVKRDEIDVDLSKYTPARYAGTKQSKKCKLIAVEGDSAMTNVRKGLVNNPKLGFDLYGIICLGGVIVNARRECNIMEIDGQFTVNKSKKLNDNKLMNTFCDVTGLNFEYKYKPGSPTYDKEMKSLKYGGIIACVDQDLDGKGFILALILNTFKLFWGELLSAGYVQWFRTPIIRAWPKMGGEVRTI